MADDDYDFDIFPFKVKSVLDEGDTAYSYFGFHANINKPIKITEGGDIHVYQNYSPWPVNITVKLDDQIQEGNIKIGDTIHYWIFLRDFTKEEQIVGNLQFTVTKFIDDETGCILSRSEVRGQKYICKNSLIFSEEFSQTNVSELTQWDKLIQLVGEPDYPFNMYLSDKTVSVENGSLVITPILTESIIPTLYQPLDLSDRCTSQIESECKREVTMLNPVTTGKITTKRTFSFKYGRVEVRAKLPQGKWILPEINLEPSDHTYGMNNYESGLIRIAFTFNSGLSTDRMFIRGGPVFRANQLFNNHTVLMSKLDGNWDEDFHNYTLIWTPERFIFYADGECVGEAGYIHSFAEDLMNEITHASKWLNGTKMAPFDQMFHVTLGLRVVGDSDFYSEDTQQNLVNCLEEMNYFWNSKDKWYPTWTDSAMKIDYVRVYAL
uniref:Uncharacterized protein n=1 Tax=Heliothis virescens TaxID=7102 RepID=A0A2A4JIM4_HELVI